jgi:hypothetical protein
MDTDDTPTYPPILGPGAALVEDGRELHLRQKDAIRAAYEAADGLPLIQVARIVDAYLASMRESEPNAR